MRGSWALVRMRHSRDGSSSGKPQWLFIKHRDQFAAEEDIVAENMTSVTTGRTMEEIASGKSRVWQSNRAEKRSSYTVVKSARLSDFEPMLREVLKDLAR